MQPRPYALDLGGPLWDTIWALCRDAEALPTDNQQHSYAQGCFSGATHSGYLFNTKFRDYGVSRDGDG